MNRSLAAVTVLSLAAALSACSSSPTAVPSASGAPSAVQSSPQTYATSPAPSTTSARPQAPVPVESNPPGDIPDNLAFVPYRNAAGRYRFTHPEGWAQTGTGSSVTFTDKLNGVTATVGAATSAPTVAQANAVSIPALRSTQAAFELVGATAVSGPYGSGVRIVYRRNSAADPVTGRRYRDEVERYEVVSGGREVVLELFGPIGADNIDAYREMINSLVIA
jgi:hypothetical protein